MFLLQMGCRARPTEELDHLSWNWGGIWAPKSKGIVFSLPHPTPILKASKVCRPLHWSSAVSQTPTVLLLCAVGAEQLSLII